MADLKGQDQLAPGHFVQKQTVLLKKIQNGGFVRANVFVKLGPCHMIERAFYI